MRSGAAGAGRQGVSGWRRPLAPAEQALLQRYFGGNLRYERIRVGATPLGISRRASSPWGSTAFFPRSCFEAADPQRPLALSSMRVQRKLVHEATHIWQRQHGDWVTLRALPLQVRYLLGRDVYGYDRTVDGPEPCLTLFRSANVEQQGQMIEELLGDEQRGAQSDKWQAVLRYLQNRPYF